MTHDLSKLPISSGQTIITLGHFTNFSGTTYISRELYNKLYHGLKYKITKIKNYSQKIYTYKKTNIEIYNYKARYPQKKYYYTTQTYAKFYKDWYVLTTDIKTVNPEDVPILNKYHDIVTQDIMKYRYKNIDVLFIKGDAGYKFCISFVNKHSDTAKNAAEFIKLVSSRM